MRPLELYFWNALFWVAYLPLSLVLKIVTNKGDILGILLIGVFFTVVLTMIFSFQGNILFQPRMVVASTTSVRQPRMITEKPTPTIELPELEEPDLVIEPYELESPKEKMQRIRQEFDLAKIENDGGEVNEIAP